jgi:hypothetical protein
LSQGLAWLGLWAVHGERVSPIDRRGIAITRKTVLVLKAKRGIIGAKRKEVEKCGYEKPILKEGIYDVAPLPTRLVDSSSLAQFLLHGEQLLFSCENASLKRTGGFLKRMEIMQQRREEPMGHGQHNELSGPLAITDRRLFMLGGVVDGFFSSHPEARFQAVYDSDYARQIRRDILIEVIPQRGPSPFSPIGITSMGGWRESRDYLLLKTRSFGFMASGPALGGVNPLLDRKEMQWELRLKEPLMMVRQPMQAPSDNETGEWFTPVLVHAKAGTSAGPSVIMEIVELKSNDISVLLKELERGQAAPVPTTPAVSTEVSTPAGEKIVARTGSWLDNYLEPGEQVQFQSMYELYINPTPFSRKRGRVALTDRRVLIDIQHGAKDGQNLIIQKIDAIQEVKNVKIPMMGMSRFFIRDSSVKTELNGQTSEMETLKRLIEASQKAHH